ncbi:MAG: hypothetical protein ACUVTV_09875, partial [Anaerolineae bacterium]
HKYYTPESGFVKSPKCQSGPLIFPVPMGHCKGAERPKPSPSATAPPRDGNLAMTEGQAVMGEW